MSSSASIATAAAVFSALGAAFNNCLFLSQALLVRQMMKEGCSDKYSIYPSLTLMGCLTLWCGYTIFVLPTPQLYVANFPGACCAPFGVASESVGAASARAGSHCRLSEHRITEHGRGAHGEACLHSRSTSSPPLPFFLTQV